MGLLKIKYPLEMQMYKKIIKFIKNKINEMKIRREMKKRLKEIESEDPFIYK